MARRRPQWAPRSTASREVGMRRFMFALLLLLIPVSAFAQKRTYHRSEGCCWGNRFSLEPYAGAMKDPFDISADDKNTTALFGFRVGYLLGGRTRLLANVGYS